MSIQRFCLPLVIGIVLSVGAQSHAAGRVRLDADSCFSGMQPSGEYPVVITVHNPGASVRGIIRVNEQTYGLATRIYSYPIDLPSGTEKRLIAYPVLTGYSSGVKVEYDGPGSGPAVLVSTSTTYDYYEESSMVQVGAIGDNAGSLEMIRTVPTGGGYSYGSNGGAPVYADCYCNPDVAPDNAAGYSGLSELVIGAGSERMSDDQWDAIREWVVGGGSLILIGGAGSLSYLDNHIAAQMSPLVNIHETAVPKLSFPLGKKATLVSDVGIVTGAPKAGCEIALAQAEIPIVSRSAYGAGLVTLIGFDPSAAPIQDMPNEAGIIKSILAASESKLPPSALQQWSGSGMTGPEDYSPIYIAGSGAGSAGFYAGRPYIKPVAADPFAIKLPSFFEVAAILAAYFMLAVPITFFVLRRAGRLEWAWFTTPVLSVVCVFVFYLFTADLYKAGLTRRTSGVLTIAAGDSGAHFAGGSEMFFPHGGSYDLELASGERLEEQPEYGSAYSLSSATDADRLETFDMLDDIAAPDYDVGNLSFRRFYFAQSVPLGGSITSDLWCAGRNLTGTVTNNTSLTLSNTCVIMANPLHRFRIGIIAPGATVTLPQRDSAPVADARQGSAALADFLFGRLAIPSEDARARFPSSAQQCAAWLTADIPSANFGPQLGKDLSTPTSVVALAVLPVNGNASGGDK